MFYHFIIRQIFECAVMKDSQPEEMGIKKEMSSKNNDFLRANAKFITSGII